MKEMIVAWAIGAISKEILNWWLGHNKDIKETVSSWDDKLDDLLQKKFHFHLPEQVHQAYDWLVTTVVDEVNKNVGDGAFLRNVMRSIYKKDATKQALLLEQAQKFAGDLCAGVLDNLPPELKGLVNEEKENIAVRVVSNRIITATPTLKKSDEEVRSDIKAAASANKINEKEGQIETKDLLNMIVETKRKLQELQTK